MQKKISLKIEDIVYGGKGISRQGGKVILVPGAIPGDEITAEITKEKPSFAEAKIEEVKNPSSSRHPSPCLHSSQCGGCSWIGVDYNQQLLMKKKTLTETLQRIGKITLKDPIQIVPSPSSSHYRNKILLRGHVTDDQQIKVGFLARNSWQQVPVKSCFLAEKEINEIIAYIQKIKLPLGKEKFRMEVFSSSYLLKEKKPHISIIIHPIEKKTTLDKLISELTSHKKVLWCSLEKNRNKAPLFPFEKDHNIIYHSYPGQFQQVNSLFNKKMRDFIASYVERENPRSILDLYGGSGNFSLQFAKKSRKLHGVEISKSAYKAANHNISYNKLPHVVWTQKNVTTFLKENAGQVDYDCIIIDPPRKGIKEDVPFILKNSPQQIIYISCDPVTLARDLSFLCKDYNIEHIRGFDFFPQTFHIETVAVLKKKTDKSSTADIP